MGTIKACGYCRVSTPTQAVEGESIDTQHRQIADFIKSKGWELTEIYSDEGATGTKIEYRYQFQRMLQDAKAGTFNIVVFTKLSRFARSARDYQNYSHELKQYDVDLVSIKENIDPTTHTGRLMAGILALIAEWEHEMIREQMSENKTKKWKENRAFIGKPPFGYKWNKEQKKLEINTPDADIYKRVVKMYIDQDMPMRDIAIKLNSEGLGGARKVWSSATISYLLKNPVYYGNYIVNQYVYVDGKNGAGTKRSKERKPSSEGISFPVDPLISKPKWDEIQEVTEKRKVKTKHSGPLTLSFFLRHSLQCGRCGARMNARIGSTRNDGFVNRYYICYYAGTSKKNIESGRKHKCSLPFLPAEEIEKRVWSEILTKFAFAKGKVIDILFDKEERDKKIADYEKALISLNEQLREKESLKKNLYSLLEKPNADIDEIHSRLTVNRDEILTLEGYINENRGKLLDLKIEIDRELLTEKFIRDNKKEFHNLYQQIQKLSGEEKILFVESMLPHPIIVNYVDPIPDDEVYHSGGWLFDFRMQFNPEMLKRFVEEGKIRLNKDKSDNSSSPNT